MVCSIPPAITDEQISAALDDAAEPAVQNHLRHCASCAARLERARAAERALASRLHRWDCPSAGQLGDYHMGLFDQEQTRMIAQHIEHCASCAAEVAQLRLFLAAEPAPAPAAPPSRPRWPGLGELIARLIAAPPGAMPALAMRGAGPAPLVAEADGVTIFLDVQPALDGNITLIGQLMADDQDDWAGALVELRQAGALQATAALDDLGGWSCGRLPAGPSELRITRQDSRSVTLPQVDLRA